MKIKTQLSILILCITLIPATGVFFLPIYQYLKSPQRYLLRNFEKIQGAETNNISELDMQMLKERIMATPNKMQILVFHGNRILVSNFPEVETGKTYTEQDLFNLIQSTARDYKYSFNLSPSLFGSKDGDFLFIYRTCSKDPPGSKKYYKYLFPLIISTIIFELICILLVIKISKTITNSISNLKKSTHRIAEGEFDETKEKLPECSINEITAVSEEIERMRLSLKENQDAKSRFIMGVSHDLRTPVALIKGYSEAITDGIVTDANAVKNSVSIIYSKADQLESMINDLINYVKLNNTDWRQRLEVVKFLPVIDDFSHSISILAGAYSRRIAIELDIREETCVAMDKNLFNRMLENLTTNAIRYTKSNDLIKIRALESGKNIKLSIEDSGLGIEETELEHIFDLFYRGTNSRREQGMGIGLSVVKTIIDVHGWNIDVKTKVGEGTCFTLTIPACSCSAC